MTYVRDAFFLCKCSAQGFGFNWSPYYVIHFNNLLNYPKKPDGSGFLKSQNCEQSVWGSDLSMTEMKDPFKWVSFKHLR